MKRNKIALAATSGLVGLSVLAGSMAYAQTTNNGPDMAELQAFLDANPAAATAVSEIESQTGGTVAGAEFDDDYADNSVVEFEVVMADGSDRDVLFTLADGSFTMEDETADDGDEDESDHDETDADEDEDEHENEEASDK